MKTLNVRLKDLISLMIPDIAQYIENVFYCLRCAELSRQIVDDITNEITNYRREHKRFVNSTSFMLGNIWVDSREYAQRNVREWCEYIDKTNDSLCNILNIILNLGYEQGEEIKTKDVAQKISKKNKDLAMLCNKYYDLINNAKNLNNQSKHILNLWGVEKQFFPLTKKVEYYIKISGQQIPISELMNFEKEKKINQCINDIINFALTLAKKENNPDRMYVLSKYDIEKYQDVEIDCEIEISDNDICPIEYISQSNGGSTQIDLRWNINSNPRSDIYLACFYNFDILNVKYTKIGAFEDNIINVFRDGKLIGRYEQVGKKVDHLHFKHFVFKQG